MEGYCGKKAIARGGRWNMRGTKLMKGLRRWTLTIRGRVQAGSVSASPRFDLFGVMGFQSQGHNGDGDALGATTLDWLMWRLSHPTVNMGGVPVVGPVRSSPRVLTTCARQPPGEGSESPIGVLPAYPTRQRPVSRLYSPPNRRAIAVCLVFVGCVPEWPIGADCKSADLRLRGFESLRTH